MGCVRSGGVGEGDNEAAFRGEEPGELFEGGIKLREMFERMPENDPLERPGKRRKVAE
jgi:hypothetical protein